MERLTLIALLIVFAGTQQQQEQYSVLIPIPPQQSYPPQLPYPPQSPYPPQAYPPQSPYPPQPYPPQSPYPPQPYPPQSPYPPQPYPPQSPYPPQPYPPQSPYPPQPYPPQSQPYPPCRFCTADANYIINWGQFPRREQCGHYSDYNQCSRCCKAWVSSRGHNSNTASGRIKNGRCICCGPC